MYSNLEIKRGEIWYVNLPEVTGSIQYGKRPVCCVSNSQCNRFSPVITVVPISTKTNKRKMVTHVEVGVESGLDKESIVLCEQIISLDKKQLICKIGECNDIKMYQINKAINIQLEMQNASYPVPKKNNDSTFNIVRLRNRIQSLKELEDCFFDEEFNKKKSGILLKNIETQIEDLIEYCERYNQKFYDYYQPRISHFMNRGLIANA